jgi:hypothetical protein
MLRGFGLKVGPTTPRTFPNRIRELVAGHATLSTIAEALLAARAGVSLTTRARRRTGTDALPSSVRRLPSLGSATSI